MTFLEDLLFTHRGLIGPGVLQISSFWAEGTPIRLNLAPDTDVEALQPTHLPAGLLAHPQFPISSELFVTRIGGALWN